ncbi:Transcription initiation factor TFIID subunit 6 [Phlyctochytrium planicorne]|nr:Transcription initiation factor TFIID subunit 6 [Phlyctochytrium planicorne]
MSVLPVETIHVSSILLAYRLTRLQSITESVGVTLKENVATTLLADVEYRLREVIHIEKEDASMANMFEQEAKKFMRHSKRSILQTEDINCALRLKNVEPLYGFTSSSVFRFKSVPQGLQRLYFLDDQEVDLDEVMFGQLPAVPLDMSFTSHWLAIDGVQPAIAQNPTPAEIKLMLSESSMGSVQYRSSQSETNFTGSRAPGTLNGEPLVKHVLSKELQMYYDKITECILSPSEELKNLAIESLARDPGIQPLLPYFIHFTTDKIVKSIRTLSVLWSMMRITRAVLDNPNLFVEPYLHQMIPNILTCIVSKKLGDINDNHFNLRSFSAQLLSFVCQKYGLIYPNLQPRITKTLFRAFLDPNKSVSCHFGAIKALAALGSEAVKILIVPNLKVYGNATLAPLRDPNGNFRTAEGLQTYQAILEILKVHFINIKNGTLEPEPLGDKGFCNETTLGFFYADTMKSLEKEGLIPKSHP